MIELRLILGCVISIYIMRFCMLLGFSDLMQRLGLLKNAN